MQMLELEATGATGATNDSLTFAWTHSKSSLRSACATKSAKQCSTKAKIYDIFKISGSNSSRIICIIAFGDHLVVFIGQHVHAETESTKLWMSPVGSCNRCRWWQYLFVRPHSQRWAAMANEWQIVALVAWRVLYALDLAAIVVIYF